MKICVGLSGGVDSSVAALLLKQQGYDVFAMFMQNWHDTEGTLHGDCEWEEDRFVAEMVARKIGIPFYFVDLSKEYRQRVVDYLFDEYSKGRTPNPDVLCNREIKFDAFLKAARKLGADMVATGHYCRKEPALGPDGQPLIFCGNKPTLMSEVKQDSQPQCSPESQPGSQQQCGSQGQPGNQPQCGRNGQPGSKPQCGSEVQPVWRILEGVDSNKDQSYFLCQLNQEQLSAAMFPIGGLCKPEVRRLAAEADLPSADKKDSQGICFVGKVDLPVFLQQKLKSVEGDVVEVFEPYYADSAKYARDLQLAAAADSWLASIYAASQPLAQAAAGSASLAQPSESLAHLASQAESLPASPVAVGLESLNPDLPANPASQAESLPASQAVAGLESLNPDLPANPASLAESLPASPVAVGLESLNPDLPANLAGQAESLPASLAESLPAAHLASQAAAGSASLAQPSDPASAAPAPAPALSAPSAPAPALSAPSAPAASAPASASSAAPSAAYLAAPLGDEELMELARAMDYSDIRFETETYRSGKKHVRKTRYKDNPWGKIIGRHEGAQFYTIGQRKGLAIGGHAEPLFVIATDVRNNIIYVGEGESHKGLRRKALLVAPEDIHWIRPDLAMEPGEVRRYRVRIRYRQPLQNAWLVMRGCGLFVVFDEPQKSITPGQFAVWYDEQGEMLGSGVI